MARHGKQQKANEEVETVPAAAAPQLDHNGGPPLTTSPISVTLVGFAALSGLGETTIYRLIRDGEIASILIGRRRVVIVESYVRYLERQRAAQGFHRYPTPWAPAGRPRADTDINEIELPPTRRRTGSLGAS